MQKFKYISTGSIAEATAALQAHGKKARIIAGGTDVLGEMNDNILPEYPEVIINIKGIASLDFIREEKRVLRIGPLTKLDDIARNKVVKEKYSMLAEASGRTASPHIREMGTLGGNICQSNRCWYYWSPDNRFNCLRKGAAKCYAFTGDARYHSIFGSTRVGDTPCTAECPGNVEIPAYLSLIREGNLAEAARILLESNPLPAVTGRVCPHFCETKCNRADYDEAVSVRCIERFMGDYVLEHPEVDGKTAPTGTREKVAIIGSGPAGLSAAYYLRKLGHRVTIFEAMPIAGGMPALGIPAYRLPAEVIQKEIAFIKALGVDIKTNTTVGKDITIPDLLKQGYKAVFVAVGAYKSRKLPIPGAELAGTLVGLDFLRDVKLGKKVRIGKRVLVLGGGNVAFDCARTALRLGAKEVHMACLESREEMPADVSEIKEGEEEGITIHPSRTFTKIIGSEGQAGGVECLDVSWMRFDENGRLQMKTVPGSEASLPADTVIFAIGQAPDLAVFAGTEGIKTTQRGTIAVDADTLATGVPGVFAGGDATSMAGSVIAAIAFGKKAAASIDRYLGGTGIQGGAEENQSKPVGKFSSACLQKTARVIAAELPVSERIGEIDLECACGLDLSAADSEASRCFNCGCVAVNPSDLAPALIALDATIKTSKRAIKAEEFFTVAGERTTVLDDDEIVVEVAVPAPKSGTKCKFIKFAMRKTIDFPIVNCAAAVKSDNGVVKSARICLNSVYTQPYRATKAEKFIEGKSIDVATAEAAANEITADSLPLLNNRYKVQIARTLIKRAILACC